MGPSSPPHGKGHTSDQSPHFSAHVSCGQTAGWIRIQLGTEVGLGPGDIVLDGDRAPPRKGAQQPPLFGPCLLWPNGRPSQQPLTYCLRQARLCLLSTVAPSCSSSGDYPGKPFDLQWSVYSVNSTPTFNITWRLPQDGNCSLLSVLHSSMSKDTNEIRDFFTIFLAV